MKDPVDEFLVISAKGSGVSSWWWGLWLSLLVSLFLVDGMWVPLEIDGACWILLLVLFAVCFDWEGVLPLGLTDLLGLDRSDRLDLEELMDVPPDVVDLLEVERVALYMALRHYCDW